MDFFRRTPEHDILPMDFRSSPENGHSRYGNRTARFAPKQTPTTTPGIARVGWQSNVRSNIDPRPRAESGRS